MTRLVHVNLRKTPIAATAIALGAFSISSDAGPTVFFTGTTIYDPDRAWSGFTIHDTPDDGGAILIDMNGNEVHRWPTMLGFPPRVLPGGFVMGGIVSRLPHQENVALVQLDWQGNEVWRFDRLEQVETQEDETVWAARQHHDWQREGSPVGYYAPGAEPASDRGRTLILAHKNVHNPDVSDKRLEDDYLLEVDWEGNVLWDWLASDHVDEFGFSGDARNAIYRSAAYNEARDSVDWLHINSATYVGPNRWYDDGDERFHPDNVIISSRNANFIAIVARSGDVVWRIGPDFRATPAQLEIGQIIGQHHPHVIPEGLPGAGNLLVFDNGGRAGYGVGNPTAPDGAQTVSRFDSRVLEIDPTTLDIVWEYSIGGQESFRFFSQYVSSAQRLPNGNTMINEGNGGRIFEVTADGDIVWEYVNPYASDETSRIYRAYRVPYDWVPQLDTPVERRVAPPPNMELRIEPQD
jgi:outer membrane protein assembly factor BamB